MLEHVVLDPLVVWYDRVDKDEVIHCCIITVIEQVKLYLNFWLLHIYSTGSIPPRHIVDSNVSKNHVC